MRSNSGYHWNSRMKKRGRISSHGVEGWGGSGGSGVDAELEAWWCKWVLHKRVACTRWFAFAARLPCLIDFWPGREKRVASLAL